MANTYTWNCRTVDTYPTNGEFTDVVYNVHWRLTGTDETGEHSATVIGTQSITVEDLDGATFVAFEDLTHEDIIGWVEAAMGADEVQAKKDGLDTTIAELVTPVVQTKQVG